MAADPVPRFRRHLADAGMCGEEDLARIDDEALATVESALQTVMNADSPSADELDRDVYATPIKFPV
jgi:pyruvate dehydrogenase E1 component alpha subunit